MRDLLPSNAKLKLVIASTPRSGTNFTTNWLKNLGIEAGHEAVFATHGRPNPRSGHCEVDVSGFVTPKNVCDLQKRGIPTIHMVRHPVRVINSIEKKWPRKEPWNVGVLRMPRFLAIAETWYHWNAELLRVCETTYRLEDGAEGAELVLGRLSTLRGFDRCPWSREQVEEAMTTASHGWSSAGTAGSWDDLPTHIQEFAQLLGYDEDGHNAATLVG